MPRLPMAHAVFLSRCLAACVATHSLVAVPLVAAVLRLPSPALDPKRVPMFAELWQSNDENHSRLRLWILDMLQVRTRRQQQPVPGS